MEQNNNKIKRVQSKEHKDLLTQFDLIITYI